MPLLIGLFLLSIFLGLLAQAVNAENVNKALIAFYAFSVGFAFGFFLIEGLVETERKRRKKERDDRNDEF